MKLKEMKIKTFSLIEEYYPELAELAEDEDVLNKINGVINQIQLDLMKYRKINASHAIAINKEDSKTINLKDTLKECYQIKAIRCKPEAELDMPNDDVIILPDDYVGNIDIYYYKYPTLVKTLFEGEKPKEESEAQDDTFEFDLDTILLEIMPYGIAADLLKMDMISNYGKYFYDRYLELKNTIDSRRSSGVVRISGGIDV